MKKRWIWIWMVLVAGFVVLMSPMRSLPPVEDSTVRTHFIDVGQGDSEFIELPNGKTILIDAGEQEAGETVVGYIRSLGYRKIDAVIATHPHADHIGGLPEVLQAFEIGSVYMPKKEHTSKAFVRLLDAIEEKEIPLYTAKQGVVVFAEDNMKAELLAPVSNEHEDLNNYSAVLKVTYGKTGLLFTGDAEKEVEEELLGADISAQVLKVGHHGSSTSSGSKFLKKVNPAYAVISCEKGNTYGHPHRETMEALARMGCTVLRTDEMGTVVLDADASGNVKEVTR